ncbi:MAG: glucose-6-phosphate dehydrogenase [Actinomycetota bacterium]
MVIFGASGDLASRKLVPALHNLQMEGLIPDASAVIGTSRTEYSHDDFQKQMYDSVTEHSRISPKDEDWKLFFKDIYYVPGDLTDEDSFRAIGKVLDEIDEKNGTRGNRIWYLALLPEFFGPAAEGIAKAGLLDTAGWHRVIVEKPFGYDLQAAKDLAGQLGRFFSEDQIFRIDHYLGKETVQNLLVFRFGNAIWEPIWNRRHIDNVQITVAEDMGVEGRGSFYDKVGALRDVGQNHLLQLLSLVAMEPPVSWDADAIRDEKVKVLRAIRRWSTRECEMTVARGQYDGYKEEEKVDPDTGTETFVAMKLMIDNWRWADVPFYVRTGKNLGGKETDIVITFKQVPHLLFAKTAVEELEQNALIVRIQPDEGFTLTFGAKVPGPDVSVRSVDMDFDYENEFGSGTPEAYERLLLDAMLGDATLFTRSDEILEAWEIVDPILDYWSSGGRPGSYKPGSWGPQSSEELPRQDGKRWRSRDAV